jgi:acyl-CoA synthetase (AMP-forming)/AMP-acid ligase II
MQHEFRRLIQGKPEDIEAAWQFCEALPTQKLTGLVAIRLEDSLRFALLFLKTLDCGGCPVLMPTPAELADYKIPVSVDETGTHLLKHTSPEVLQPQAGTYFAFSSGSTGVRKPFRFHRERALANAQAHANSLGIDSHHQIVQTLRVHHPFGVVAYLFTPLACKARIELGVYFDSLFPLQRESDLPNHVVHLTPYHLQSLQRRHSQTTHRVGKLTLGAGPVRREEALYALGLCEELYTTYGLSEAGPRVSTGKVKSGTFVDGWIGHFLEGITYRVERDGSLWIKTPYYADSEVSHGDYFNTGDRVELLADGSVVFKNRLQDVLRIRGQTHTRASYNQRLERLTQLCCEIYQRPYSDALLLFIESSHPNQTLEKSLWRAIPELRGAQIVWRDSFERTALGKPDLRKMLLQSGISL